MRLTLRTLLAYLDDILEPAQAREIGQKIEESSLATSLVGRIREVMRRRRLTAPHVSGSVDLDGNIIAEYLDNTLPPEGVENVEKVCLESDIHLAEVAACHQILTLVLGEPVEITPESRERMYGLAAAVRKTAETYPTILAAAPSVTPAAGSIPPATPSAAAAPVAVLPAADRPRNSLPPGVLLQVHVESGPHKGETFQLGQPGSLTVGRGSANRIRLNRDSHFSRFHCRLEATATECHLIDLGSRNGTFVNGVRAKKEVAVHDGDIVSGGKTKLQVAFAGQAAVAAAKPVAPVAAPEPVAATSAASVAAAASIPVTPAVRPAAISIPTPDNPSGWSNATPAAGGQPSFHESIPDYLKPRPIWKQLLPYAAVVVLLGIWLFLVAREFPMFANRPADSGLPVVALNEPATGDDHPAKPVENTEPATRPAVKDDRVALTEARPPREKPLNIDAAPPQEEPDEEFDPASVAPPAEQPDEEVMPEQPVRPARSVAAVPAAVSPEKGAAAVKPNPAPAPAVPAAAGPAVQYTSNEGELLRYDVAAQGWFVMPRRAMVQPGDKIAVPEPFEATCVYSAERDSFQLLSGTIATVLGPTAAAPVGLDIRRGRVLLRGRPADNGDADVGPTMAVSIRGDLWRLELLQPESLCGVEVEVPPPTRFEQEFVPQYYKAHVYVMAGSVRLADSAGNVQAIEAPARLELAHEPIAAPPAADGAEVSLPDWLHEKKPSFGASNYSKVFAKEFDLEERVSVSLVNSVQDRRPEMARLGVSCLGLIEDYDGMLQALGRNEHEEARLQAIAGLRNWINLEPDNREKVKESIAKHFHTEEADAIYHLLWGYEEKDGKDPKVSARLINWMGHDSLAVRELAFFYVQKLTGGRRLEYRPNNSPQQRKSAINSWLRHLEKEKALVPANPARSASARSATFR